MRFVPIVPRRRLPAPSGGNVSDVAATALDDRPGPSRMVAAAVGAVAAIFAAMIVLAVAVAAAGFAVRWALTLGG